MTTAAGRPLSRFNAIARTMAHYSMWFAAWLCTTNVLMTFAPNDGLVTWTLVSISLATAFIPLLISYYGDQVHIWAWDCPTCVARTPILNGDEEVARRRGRLHWVHDRKRLLTYGMGSLTLYIAAPLLMPGVGWWRQLMSLPFYVVWVYTCMAGEAHRNLAPWCPWCRRRRGDDDVPVDVVPPTPSGVKTDA